MFLGISSKSTGNSNPTTEATAAAGRRRALQDTFLFTCSSHQRTWLFSTRLHPHLVFIFLSGCLVLQVRVVHVDLKMKPEVNVPERTVRCFGNSMVLTELHNCERKSATGRHHLHLQQYTSALLEYHEHCFSESFFFYFWKTHFFSLVIISNYYALTFISPLFIASFHRLNLPLYFCSSDIVSPKFPTTVELHNREALTTKQWSAVWFVVPFNHNCRTWFAKIQYKRN